MRALMSRCSSLSRASRRQQRKSSRHRHTRSVTATGTETLRPAPKGFVCGHRVGVFVWGLWLSLAEVVARVDARRKAFRGAEVKRENGGRAGVKWRE
jgi:hypothetical protein